LGKKYYYLSVKIKIMSVHTCVLSKVIKVTREDLG